MSLLHVYLEGGDEISSSTESVTKLYTLKMQFSANFGTKLMKKLADRVYFATRQLSKKY